MPSRSTRSIPVSLTLLAVLVPAPVLACGGFFCSQTPVDQTAERIIFAVEDDDRISAYVQISYQGERDDFAWVVPVPDVPELDTFPQLAVSALDLATQPVYFGPVCGFALEDSGGVSGPSPSDGVIVLDEQVVGPFETVTIEGESAQELVDWLQDRDYRITDAMVPLVQLYVDDGMKFLALRLSPDADVSDIEPIRMTYPGTRPMIPIRLTAVAAEPEMGIITWVLADRRYGPDNFADLEIDDDLIELDPFGFQSNYLPVVSREVDRAGGQAFVTEYAAPTAELVEQLANTFVPPDPDSILANAALIELLQAHDYVTRLYTRISPEEMTLDPVFRPSRDRSDVSNIHDLSDRPIPDDCPPPPPCVFAYCGPDAICAEAGDLGSPIPACVCEGDTAARPVTGVGGAPAVYCESLSADVASADPGFGDPCLGVDCGTGGTCESINGAATCRCADGLAGVSTSLGSVTCTEARVASSPGDGGGSDSGCGGCGVGPGIPADGALVLLALVLAARRVTRIRRG